MSIVTKWVMNYTADTPADDAGTLGPYYGFSPEFGSPNKDILIESVLGWGDWFHPVRGGKPTRIGFMIIIEGADYDAARAAQVAALAYTGTVGTLLLQRTGSSIETFSNVCLPNGGVGEPFLWALENVLILPLSFIQGGAVS